MELKDACIDMKVTDRFGNEYEVIGIEKCIMPIKLLCTKFVKRCKIDGDLWFEEEGDLSWIVESEVAYKKHTGHDVEISLKSIRPIEEEEWF